MKTQAIIITSTYPTKEEALSIGKAVVDRRLAACAQISSPITSIYRWQNEVCLEEEYRLILKTTLSNKALLVDYLKSNHSYDLPEIIITPITGISEEFLLWIDNETK